VKRPVILNPLPKALHHYEGVLRNEILGSLVEWRHASVEIGSVGIGGRLAALWGALRAYLVLGLSRRTVMSLWPTFGLLDALAWRLVPGRGRRVVIVHDAVPLRRQFGYGRCSRWLARLALGRRVQLAVHTQLAGDALRAHTLEPAWLAPFPVGKPSPTDRARSRSVLVAGQFKDARDTALMEALGQTLAGELPLLVRGRGWPEIGGWDVDSRFLSEEELDAELRSAGVVLIPYERYFQSDIAVRAVESNTPIVALRHEFIEGLLGQDWPGLVDSPDPMAWVQAIDRTLGLAIPVGTASSSRVRAEWLRILGIDDDRA
jgi:hypothetical protein